MNFNDAIIINNKNNILNLIYNDSVLFPRQYESITFKFEDNQYNINILVEFSLEGEPLSSFVNVSEHLVKLKLISWDSEAFIESSTPMLVSMNNKTYHIVWRTSGAAHTPLRQFSISVWTDYND
ncbi:MAG: hypothetical protein NTW25_00495 [Candidatus Kapabacteria bacterium]|nr:hypothetical protein [Candidatus Kapabacteria bacterium]